MQQHPLLSRFAAFIIFPLVALSAAVFLYMRTSLPETEMRLYVQGIESNVVMVRDERGALSIRAQNDDDAYFALGYAHAQDRMWQLFVQKLLVEGRLAEVFGEPLIAEDARMRALGVRRSAVSAWDSLSDRARSSLTAYAKGVNAWIAEGHTLPFEFYFFSVQPEPWEEVDSLAWINILALSLDANATAEVHRYVARQYLSEREFFSLFPETSKRPSLTAEHKDYNMDMSLLLEENIRLEKSLSISGKNAGSNAWAISGRFTNSGKPLLAGDPHLRLQVPSLWYAVKMSGHDLDVEGMSLVGLPLVVFGRNEHIAWTGTAMQADVQDLYIEQVNPLNPDEYLGGDAWKKFDVWYEEIKVRLPFPRILRPSSETVTVKVRRSTHGPIISDFIGMKSDAVALRWAALGEGNTTYEAFFLLAYADNWESFRNALRWQVAPAMNFLYIDREGNIGYQGAGRVPIRGRDRRGLPASGVDEDDEWKGYIPYDDMPSILNPDSGYIINANNRPVSDDYQYQLSEDWGSAARASRIEYLIKQKIKDGTPMSEMDMREIQLDTVDTSARKLVALLDGAVSESDEVQAALERMALWDGNMSLDSKEAAVFQYWFMQIKKDIFSKKMGAHWGERKSERVMNELLQARSTEDIYRALSTHDGVWCANESADPGCRKALLDSLENALHQMDRDHSSEDIRLKHVQEAVFTHLPMSRIRGLDILFERRRPTSGSESTINVAATRYVKSNGFVQEVGPSFRHIMHFDGAVCCYKYQSTTGQSGNIMSGQYDDWLDVVDSYQYSEIGGVQASSLVLLPAHEAHRIGQAADSR